MIISVIFLRKMVFLSMEYEIRPIIDTLKFVPPTTSTWPTSSDEKLSPPNFLSLSAHRENICKMVIEIT